MQDLICSILDRVGSINLYESLGVYGVEIDIEGDLLLFSNEDLIKLLIEVDQKVGNYGSSKER